MNRVFSRVFILGKVVCLLIFIGFPADSSAEKTSTLTEVVNLAPESGEASEIRHFREELRQAMERQDARLKRIEEALKTLKSLETSARPPMLPAIPVLAPSNSSPTATKVLSNLTVCNQGCDFQDLQKAVDAAPRGGTVSVSAEINGSCAVINKPLRLIGLRGVDGQRAHLGGGVCWGKAPLVTVAENIVIEGFEISGVSIKAGNGVCIRMDTGTQNLIIRNLYCHDSQMALLGSVQGRLLIEDSVFERTADSPGLSHGFYLANGDEAIIRRSKILSTNNAGHSLKCGYLKLIIEDSVIAALNAHNSRAIDMFRGGEAELRRNIIQQGPQSDNNDVIGLALEPKRGLASRHSIVMEDNWIIFDHARQGNKVLFRGQTVGAVLLRNNVFVGMDGLGVDTAKEEGNQWFDTREQARLRPFNGSLESLPIPGIPAVTGGDSQNRGASWRLF